jgi:hypothetical protein
MSNLKLGQFTVVHTPRGQPSRVRLGRRITDAVGMRVCRIIALHHAAD